MAELERFKQKIREYRLLSGHTQSDLALYLNLDYTELSNRLNGKKRARLSHENVRVIVRALAEWGGIASQAQARELLDMMECPYFDPVDWSARPLNRLKADPIPPLNPAPVQVDQSKILAPPPSPTAHLPVPLSSFIGREREVAEVASLLGRDEVRLLTLTGAGGIGKTRLALQVAGHLQKNFKDGVYFVDLTPVSNHQLVIVALGKVFNLQEMGRQNLEQALQTYLSDKKILLIFDNFEHVTEAAGLLNTFLTVVPGLKILVTSREALHLYGEYEFELAPLNLPDINKLPPPDQLEKAEAVALFVQRARAVRPGFRLEDQNAVAVAEICVRLEGWPLALELAATYAKLLSSQELLSHLKGVYGETSLEFLQVNTRDRPERHQTMRKVLDWSYNLCDEAEKDLFNRLGVFVGGCSFEMVQAICFNGPTYKLLAGLGSLLDKSLIYQTRDVSTDTSRYYMLEPVHRYAQEQLVVTGREMEVRRRHAEYFLRLAEQVEPELKGRNQLAWLGRLDQEHFNFQDAFNWAVEQTEPELVYGLAGALGGFWEIKGYLTEGRRMLETALGLPAGSEAMSKSLATNRAKVMVWAATLAFRQGDYQGAIAHVEEGLGLFQLYRDRWGEGWALRLLGTLQRHQGHFQSARQSFEQSLALFQTLEDQWGIAWALSGLGSLLHDAGEYAVCREVQERSLALFRQIGDQRNIAYLLNSLGELARGSGDYSEAARFYGESLELNQKIDYKAAIVITLHNLGYISLHQHNNDRAEEIFRQCLKLNKEMGRKRGIAACLVGLAGVAATRQHGERAARLLGAAEALREAIHTRLDGADLTEYEAIVDKTSRQMAQNEFKIAWEHGRRSGEEVVNSI